MRNITNTHAAAGISPHDGGTANIRMNTITRAIPPPTRKGMRVPVRPAARSDRRPTVGRAKTSQAFGTATTAAASPAATPRVSVRKNANTKPGTVENTPVPTEPKAYAVTVLPGKVSGNSWCRSEDMAER